MTRLIIVRHGQTEWNRVERFRGRADLELNPAGIRQAQAIAQRLPAWTPVAVYSSPLKRAWQTAAILAQPLGLGVEPLEGLIDMDFGTWQGLTPEEARARDPQLYRLWLEAPHRVRFPGGEGLEEVRGRAQQAVDRVSAAHPDSGVVLVSHKVVCKVLTLLLLDADNSHYWEIEQDNAAITIFDQRSPYWMASLINDTCHLKGVE